MYTDRPDPLRIGAKNLVAVISFGQIQIAAVQFIPVFHTSLAEEEIP
jgi:hypothetical protein